MTKVVESIDIYKNLSIDDIDGEIWKDIEGYSGEYKVSNLGRIKSISRVISNGRGYFRSSDKILAQSLRAGYCRISFRMDDKRKTHTVHRIVANAFIPNSENKPFVNHIDANKTNNCVWNLEWCTHLENIHHAYDNLLIPLMRGTRNGVSKLSEADVILIKELLKNGNRPVDIAKDFNIAAGAIYQIRYKKNWYWLE